MPAQCLTRPELSAALVVQMHHVPVTVLQAAGRTIHFSSTAQLVPGALLQLQLRRGDASAQIWVQIKHVSEEDDTPAYQSRVVTTLLPEWLFRQLDTRLAFRVAVASGEEIAVKLTLGGQRLRGVLHDASQDGAALLCGIRLETASQLGRGIALEFELPEGRVNLKARLRRLKAVGSQTRMGIEFVDDGSLSYRRSRSAIRSYVMRRQREIAQRRVET